MYTDLSLTERTIPQVHERKVRTDHSKGAGWTDERVEMLKKLWAAGLSASQIAGQLGRVTRNAVIGKVHRLSLSGRAKPVSTTPRQPRVQRRAPPRPSTRHYISGNTAFKVHAHPQPHRLPAPVVIEDIDIPAPLNVALLALRDHMCKWPIGDPDEETFAFCGHKNWNGLPYCEYHSRVAYRPSEKRFVPRYQHY